MKRPTIESLAQELRGAWVCIAHLIVCIATLALACLLCAVGAMPGWGFVLAGGISFTLFLRGLWIALLS